MAYRHWVSVAAALVLTAGALAACEKKTEQTTDASGQTTQTNTVGVDEQGVKNAAQTAAAEVTAGATAVARGVKEGVQEGKAQANQALGNNQAAANESTTTTTTTTRR
jgi:hypothetical protein